MLREVVSNDFFTILLLICLVLITVVKYLYPKRFQDFTTVLFSFKYLNIYSRQKKTVHPFHVLLFLNFLISVSIFVYLMYSYFYPSLSGNWYILFYLFLFLIFYVVFKMLLELFIGNLFNIKKYINVYVFQKISYKLLFGILLIPVNGLLLYTINNTSAIFYFIVFLFLALNVASLFSTIKVYQSLIKSKLFYFILYLCALEISPLILIYYLVIRL